MMRKPWLSSAAFLCGGVVLLLTGCDKLTRNHYEMIVVDVSNTYDVEKTIGEPTHTMDDQWHYQREDKHLNVFIDFNDAGVVVRKQWVDAESREWDDTQKPEDADSHESTEIRSIDE